MKSLPRPLARPNRVFRKQQGKVKSLVQQVRKIALEEIERTAHIATELLGEDKEENPIKEEAEVSELVSQD